MSSRRRSHLNEVESTSKFFAFFTGLPPTHRIAYSDFLSSAQQQDVDCTFLNNSIGRHNFLGRTEVFPGDLISRPGSETSLPPIGGVSTRWYKPLADRNPEP